MKLSVDPGARRLFCACIAASRPAAAVSPDSVADMSATRSRTTRSTTGCTSPRRAAPSRRRAPGDRPRRSARLQELHRRRQGDRPTPAKGQPQAHDATYKEQCKQLYQQLPRQVMEFLISSTGSPARPRSRASRSTDAQVQKLFDNAEEAAVPSAGGLPEVPQAVRPDASGRPPLPRPQLLEQKIKRKRAKHTTAVTARPDPGLLQQEQVAVRHARVRAASGSS